MFVSVKAALRPKHAHKDSPNAVERGSDGARCQAVSGVYDRR